MPFQKGNQLGKNSIHQRRDLTMELIAQLDEVLKYKHPLTKEKRTFKQRIVRNLIRRAATSMPSKQSAPMLPSRKDQSILAPAAAAA
jgi:hypothetical protein